MNTPISFQWRLRPVCIALGCALAVALFMWVRTLSSSADYPPVTLAGNAVAASACIARKLVQAPRLPVENQPGTPPA